MSESDIGGLVHVRRIGTDEPTPCGINLTGPGQSLTTGSSVETVTCPICLIALKMLLEAAGTRTF